MSNFRMAGYFFTGWMRLQLEVNDGIWAMYAIYFGGSASGNAGGIGGHTVYNGRQFSLYARKILQVHKDRLNNFVAFCKKSG